MVETREPVNGTIILVDDLPDSLRLYEKALAKYFPDCTVIRADSGAKAIAMARSRSPDLLVLDVYMPDMDGFAVCEKIKRDPRLRSVPVLLISGVLVDTADRVRGLQVGADAYLCKPFDVSELCAYASRLLALKKEEDRLRRQEVELQDALASQLAELQERDARFRRAISHFESPFVVYDSALRYRFVNEHAERVLARSQGDLLDHTDEELFSARVVASFSPALKKAIQTGEPQYAMRIVDERQEEAAVPFLYVPVPDASGAVAEVLGIARRAREGERPRDRLAVLGAQLEQAALLARFGTWTWDLAGDRVEWSRELHAICGVTQEEFGGSWEAHLACVDPADRERVRRATEEAVGERRPFQHELRVLCPDGTQKRLLCRGSVQTDERGRPAYVYGISVDVTDRRQMEQELRLLLQVTHAFAASEDLTVALRLTLERICEYTGWAVGEVWMPTEAGQDLELSPAWFGRSSEYERMRAASVDLRFGPDEGLPGRVWSRREMMWYDDLANDPRFLRCEVAQALGLRSGVGVPVQTGDRVVAVICFFMAETTKTDQRLADFILAFASQLAVLFRRKHAEEQVRKLLYETGGRVKELTLLQHLSQLLQQEGRAPEDVLQAVVERLRYAWRYPEKAAVRLTHEKGAFETENFVSTSWKVTAEIPTEEGAGGELEIVHVEAPDTDGEECFSAEEKELLTTICQMLGRWLDRKAVEEEEARIELLERERRFRAELQEAHSLLKRMSRQLDRAHEEERRRIGHELHDHVGQNLTVLQISLKRCLAMPQEEA